MGKLLKLLGHDERDPQVAGARRDASVLSNVIHSLVRARVARHLKQEDVAVAMGTTQSAISNFERTGGDPKISTVLRYARAVGVRVTFVVQAESRNPLVSTRLPLGGTEEFILVNRGPGISVGPSPSVGSAMSWAVH
jgi:DNA-binding XRE family transcriptional regulator